MTLQQLKYVIEIVNYGSINEAAKRLFISQPSLSNAVKELEHELNIEIFKRSSRGIALSPEGGEFLGYARQVVEQTALLEQRYLHAMPTRPRCSISTQHYAFAVDAFVRLIETNAAQEYDFTLRETRTYEIIEDVHNLSSEVGILYRNDFNYKVMEKLFKENNLEFHTLFVAKPHVFLRKEHPLSQREQVNFQDLEEYPYLSFEQGQYNSFYFSEEIQSTIYHKKSIRVSDRATLFNLLIGLDGYTISSGIMSTALNGDNILAVPLDVDDSMELGYLTNTQASLSRQAELYISSLIDVVAEYGLSAPL